MLNKKTKQFIKEFKFVLENYYVDKKAIQREFDKYFELIGLPKRNVEFYQNLEDFVAAQNVAWDTSWNATWSITWNVARNTAWSVAQDDAWDTAWDAAWDITQDVAWNAAWYAFWGDSWDAPWNAPWNAPRYTAWDAAWDAACLNSCGKDDDCKICEFRRKFCEPIFSLLRNGVFIYWILKDKAIVIIRPKIRHLNGRLHSTTQPAIEWKNEKYYFLWGVRLDKNLWQKIVNKKLSFKQIMSLENIEQRMVALKMMDAENLLRESKAKLLHKSEKGNELYLIENIFRQPAYFLKYTCPSTGRVYISGIDPKIAKENPNADFCMSWKLGITLDDYLKNIITET